MDFSELIHRANLYSIETHLLSGSEILQLPKDKSFSDKLKAAEKNADNFFKNRYPKVSEYDEVTSYFYEQAEVYKDVYFEIGLILGAKIAFQISGKMRELS